jgi:hypothetical protein
MWTGGSSLQGPQSVKSPVLQASAALKSRTCVDVGSRELGFQILDSKCCVTSGQLLSLSVLPFFPICKMGIGLPVLQA